MVELSSVVSVVSAVDLNESQVLTLKGVLSKKLNRDIDLALTIDRSAIGGLRIVADGYLVDLTIRKHLEDLKETLLTRIERI